MQALDTTHHQDVRELQAILGLAEGLQFEFLVDCGVHVSIIPFYVIQQMRLEHAIRPTSRLVKFGSGEVQCPIGSISMNLMLSDELHVTHRYLVMKN
ncbi:hypothetical protein INT45_010715 [Circinella minor]|uniref:Uncharacterized protein n=1 Tax=Circinella minor TaxID=1195481 RepID=A0A8H7RQC9_9FUNG|nr:hypothetical protein INT45_010715 [Circinella minor]